MIGYAPPAGPGIIESLTSSMAKEKASRPPAIRLGAKVAQRDPPQRLARIAAQALRRLLQRGAYLLQARRGGAHHVRQAAHAVGDHQQQHRLRPASASRRAVLARHGLQKPKATSPGTASGSMAKASRIWRPLIFVRTQMLAATARPRTRSKQVARVEYLTLLAIGSAIQLVP